MMIFFLTLITFSNDSRRGSFDILLDTGDTTLQVTIVMLIKDPSHASFNPRTFPLTHFSRSRIDWLANVPTRHVRILHKLDRIWNSLLEDLSIRGRVMIIVLAGCKDRLDLPG